MKRRQATTSSSGDTFANGMLKDLQPLKKNAAKYKNIDFHARTLVWDLEKMAAAGAGGKAAAAVAKSA